MSHPRNNNDEYPGTNRIPLDRSLPPLADRTEVTATKPSKPRKGTGRVAVAVYGLLFGLLIGSVASGGQSATETTEAAATPTATVTVAAPARPVAPAKVKAKAAPKPDVKPQDTPKEAAPVETSGQANARGAAENYLENMPFSRVGLIEQLKFEGYSNADAIYGADHAGADWMEQAVRSAKNYLSNQNFSKAGLIEQLKFESYTTEQATYGATQALK